MINKILNLINPENKDLNFLSKNEFLEMIIKLNKCLRCLDETTEVIHEYMKAGDLVSPTKEVQADVLEYLLQNLSKVNDKKAKATMVYYTLINLHMFDDGNGRTSRFMYDLISEELSDNSISYYFHKSSNYTEKQNNNLEESKGIIEIDYVNQMMDNVILNELNFIPDSIKENYDWITVGRSSSSPSLVSILPKNVSEKLSKKELNNLNQILRDNYGVSLTPSGLAFLYVANKKGQLAKWLEINKSKKSLLGLEKRLNFSIFRNTHMIEDWTIEDFREIIRVGNFVKYTRLKSIIDVFVQPEIYINPYTGNSYYDDILGKSKNK